MTERIINELVHVLCAVESASCILRVGLGREPSDSQKIDIMMGIHDGSIDTHATVLQSALYCRWPTLHTRVSDDCVRFAFGSYSGGIAVCDPIALTQRVERYSCGQKISGEHRPWSDGYWIPEALCGDLATAELLHDGIGSYVRLKELVTPYPEPLANAIITLCTEEISQKLERVEYGTGVESVLRIADITSALTRFAFARSRVYLRGFKNINRQAMGLSPLERHLCRLVSRLSMRHDIRDVVDELRALFLS